MATTNDTIDLKDRCLLVSDSDEIQTQMDSKKLPYITLADMAQDALFGSHLDRYLTVQEYKVNKSQLENTHRDLNIPTIDGVEPKFKAVEGQVILLKADSIPEGVSPMDYALAYWDVPSEYQLTPVPDGMLRGVLMIEPKQSLVVQCPDNVEVKLTEETMPPHMHHSAITTGGDFTTLEKGSGDSYAKKGNTTYDMFHSDSLNIGLDKNEMDGTVDYFEVLSTGENIVTHNNIPPYASFYGFVVVRK